MPISSTYDTVLSLPGAVGQLEAILTQADAPTQHNKPDHSHGVKPGVFGIVCHPHPLHGGTMHNKVVTTISRSLRELGIDHLRFNFRGVGKSAGSYGEGLGEIDDLLRVVDWVRAQYPEREIWLLGFSFGSYISAAVAQRLLADATPANPPSTLLVSVAPAVNLVDFLPFADIDCPWIVVQAEHDEIVPAQAITDWVAEIPKAIDLVPMAGCSHFFHGQLSALRTALKTQLQRHICP